VLHLQADHEKITELPLLPAALHIPIRKKEKKLLTTAMKNSDSDRHLAVPSMKRLGSIRKKPFFHSKSFFYLVSL
jgi:hypothetical protein